MPDILVELSGVGKYWSDTSKSDTDARATELEAIGYAPATRLGLDVHPLDFLYGSFLNIYLEATIGMRWSLGLTRKLCRQLADRRGYRRRHLSPEDPFSWFVTLDPRQSAPVTLATPVACRR